MTQSESTAASLARKISAADLTNDEAGLLFELLAGDEVAGFSSPGDDPRGALAKGWTSGNPQFPIGWTSGNPQFPSGWISGNPQFPT